MKRLLLVFFALFAFAAQAQIIPSIPYTLTNGSLADATQVMGNFNTIVTDVNTSAATSGANTNITSLTGITTPIANTYGGTSMYLSLSSTAGTANAQTLGTVVPSNFSLTVGNIVTGVAGATNNASMTLNVNNTGAKQTAITTALGLSSTPANSVIAGSGYVWYFDGTYFELLNPSTNANLTATQAFTASQAVTPTTLTIATSTFTPTFATSNNFDITLVHASCPCTLANPSGTIVPGTDITIEVKQSSTGSDTITSYGTYYKFANAVSPTLSTAANATDLIPCHVSDATHLFCGFTANFAQ